MLGETVPMSQVDRSGPEQHPLPIADPFQAAGIEHDAYDGLRAYEVASTTAV
jgi:hypothetical protein